MEIFVIIVLVCVIRLLFLGGRMYKIDDSGESNIIFSNLDCNGHAELNNPATPGAPQFMRRALIQSKDKSESTNNNSENKNINNMLRGTNHNAPITVIGVGGGALYSIRKMIETPLEDVEYCIVASNKYALQSEKFQDKATFIAINPARNIPYVYDDACFNRYYANDKNEKMVRSIIDQSTRHVIIVAGFGGGMGTMGSKWLAKLYKKLNVDVTIVCTVPFSFEGNKKRERALDAIKSLEELGITVKVIYADEIRQKHEDFNLFNCFSYLDEHVAEAVAEICSA